MQNIWLVTVYQVDKNHDFSKDMTLTCNTGCLPSRLVKHACQWETRPPMVRRAGGWNSICADGVRWRQYAPLPSSRPRPHSSLLSKLVVSASSHHPDMTPPAPVLVALALSGFALLSCLGMLAVTLQREIDVEVGAARFSWNSISCFPVWKSWGGGGAGGGLGGRARLPHRRRGLPPLFWPPGAFWGEIFSESLKSTIIWIVQEWNENCKLRPDPGPCRGRLPRYYFLPRCHLGNPYCQNLFSSISRTGKCIQFPWGGCGGNANNFISASRCRAICSKAKAQANPVPAALQESPLVKVSWDFLGQILGRKCCLAIGRRGIRQLVTWNQRQGLATRDSPGKLKTNSFHNSYYRWYFSQGKCQRWVLLPKVRVVGNSSGFNMGDAQATGTTLGA